VNARDFALFQLDHKSLPDWKPDLRKPSPPLPSDPRDRALGERIAEGVVKNLLFLRFVIEHLSGKSRNQIDPLVEKILAIALYQMRFLDRVPASAAVDQAVEQTKRFGRCSATGFVNAVLRNVQRKGWPAEPDAQADPEAYGERVLSHPRELFCQLAELLGPQKAVAFCRHDNTEPPTVLRLFSCVDASAFTAPGVEIAPHSVGGLVVARGAKMETLRDWAQRGLAQVQDATAAGVVDHLQLSEGMTVLDRCAGLGTKTLQLWDRVGPTGEVVAMDASAFRCTRLRELLKLRAISNVKVVEGAKMAASTQNFPPSFDRILVDVPCSNSGVLARRPEARYRASVDCLAKIQRQILDDTLPFLSPGGIIVYSTCSVWPEENERQIAQFLAEHPQLDLIEQKLTWPSFETDEDTQYHDGGYSAALRRIV
jgi:16S rRNA (cytosine967-C5)-methyltransferase